jgi:hypothetical protein
LYTIVFKHPNSEYVPGIHVVMRVKTEAVYVMVFGAIRDLLLERSQELGHEHPNIGAVRKIVTDFEQGAINAVEQVHS